MIEEPPRPEQTPNEFQRFVIVPPELTQLPPLDQVTRASVCWICSEGTVRRYEAMPGKDWVLTTSVEINKPGMPQDISEEEWVRRLNQREKQVQIGKSTTGYRNLQQLPPEERPSDVRSPRVQEDICSSSKKAFDTCVREWRV